MILISFVMNFFFNPPDGREVRDPCSPVGILGRGSRPGSGSRWRGHYICFGKNDAVNRKRVDILNDQNENFNSK